MIRKQISHIFYFGYFVINIIVFSCSSRNEDGVSTTDGSTTLRIHLNGISGVENISSVSSTILKETSSNKSIISKSTTYSTKKFDADLSILDMNTNLYALAKKNRISPITSVSPIPIGIKYRIIMKNIETGILTNVIGTSGTPVNIKVDAGKTYQWFIFSTNETSLPPDIDNNGLLLANNITNKDFVYKSGSINTIYGENNLNAVLDRKTVKYLVNISTSELNAKVNNSTKIELGKDTGTGFTSIMETGDFNIFSGNYNSTQSFSAISGGLVDSNNGYTRTAAIYTKNTDLISTNQLRLKFNTLDATYVGDGAQFSYGANNLPFSNSTFTPTLGNLYSMNVNIRKTSFEEIFGPFGINVPASRQNFSDAATLNPQTYGKITRNGFIVLDGNVNTVGNTYIPQIKNVSGGNLILNLRCHSRYWKNTYNITNQTLANNSLKNIDADNIVWFGGASNPEENDWCEGTITHQATGNIYVVSLEWNTTGGPYNQVKNYLEGKISWNNNN